MEMKGFFWAEVNLAAGGEEPEKGFWSRGLTLARGLLPAPCQSWGWADLVTRPSEVGTAEHVGAWFASFLEFWEETTLHCPRTIQSSTRSTEMAVWQDRRSVLQKTTVPHRFSRATKGL